RHVGNAVANQDGPEKILRVLEVIVERLRPAIAGPGLLPHAQTAQRENTRFHSGHQEGDAKTNAENYDQETVHHVLLTLFARRSESSGERQFAATLTWETKFLGITFSLLFRPVVRARAAR